MRGSMAVGTERSSVHSRRGLNASAKCVESARCGATSEQTGVLDPMVEQRS